MIDDATIKRLIDEVMNEENTPAVNTPAINKPQQSTSYANTQPSINPVAADKPKPKTTVVTFDSKTDHPYNVIFSERGFQIQGVRMSFETIETAINKNYDIILNETNFRLTQIIMTKIMKYKDLY